MCAVLLQQKNKGRDPYCSPYVTLSNIIGLHLFHVFIPCNLELRRITAGRYAYPDPQRDLKIRSPRTIWEIMDYIAVIMGLYRGSKF